MIVKKEEWDKLQKSKDEIEASYEEKISTLKSQIRELVNEIEELKKERNLDNIEVNIFKREVDKYGYWKDEYSVQLERTKIDLSQGIRSQILRIFRNSLNFFYKEYQEKLKIKENEIYNLRSQRTSLMASIEKLPLVTTRKKVIKIYNNVITKL